MFTSSQQSSHLTRTLRTQSGGNPEAWIIGVRMIREEGKFFSFLLTNMNVRFDEVNRIRGKMNLVYCHLGTNLKCCREKIWGYSKIVEGNLR